MRVAIDASFLALPPSGIGTYLRALAEAMRTTNPEVELALLDPGWEEDLAVSEELASNVVKARPGWIGRSAMGQRRLRRFAWELEGVAAAARAVKPDLLHIPHFSAPVRPGIPLVVTIHDVIPLVLPAYRASRAMRLHLALMRRTVRRATLVLTPSETAASDIERVLVIPRARIRVTPEAAGPAYTPADDPSTSNAAARSLGIDRRYIFNIGGLDVRKNLPVLLEAFARALPRLREPTQLVIAGAPHSANPAVFPPLAPVIERLGVGDHVVLTGRIGEAEKLALYRGAGLYVTPSLAEGFGLTALEAMACGVPTIAANRTSFPEVIGDGGLLVEPLPEPLAAAMIAILDNPQRAADLRARGIARAATFTWERTARLTMAAYEEAVDGRR